MAWTEIQQAMLREMGLRTWSSAVPMAPAEAPTALDAHDEVMLMDEPVSSPAPVEARQPSPLRQPAVAREPAQAPPAREPDGTIVRAPALDWPELRQAVADCRACTLCETRRQTVFGVGHPKAEWMVVGEAPGEQEDRQGEPFVGAAGQLLDAMLRSLRLTRAEDGDVPASQRVYIANTLKCRPPGNRNPQPDELAKCEPFLVRQIELVQPRIILAMGRFAVQALLRTSDAIGKLRGKVHRYQGVPLIVTYHPAYLLRSLTDKARAWEDLCLAAAVAEKVAETRKAEAP